MSGFLSVKTVANSFLFVTSSTPVSVGSLMDNKLVAHSLSSNDISMQLQSSRGWWHNVGIDDLSPVHYGLDPVAVI